MNAAPRIKCPQCQKSAEVDSKFCRHCAFSLKNLEVHSNIFSVKDKSKSPNPVVPLLIGTIAIALTITGIYWFSIKSSEVGSNDGNSNISIPVLSPKSKVVEAKILRGEQLTVNDLEGIPTSELRILRNVNFARHGRSYGRPGLGDYFISTPWYKPNSQYDDKLLTAADKANTNLIFSREADRANANLLVSNAATTAPPPESPPSSTTSQPAPSSNGVLTLESAQAALDRFMSSNATGSMTIRGGVREIPAQNSAVADLVMDNFRSNDGKFFPDSVRHRSLSWSTGIAEFSRYTDGRWVLSQVIVIQDSLGYRGTYKTNIEVR